MPVIPRALYGRPDYSAIPSLLHAAEALGFRAAEVNVEQSPAGSRVKVEFFYEPEVACK